MALDVAVDNSVISNYVAEKLSADQINDKKAFKEMIALSKRGIIELGGPWTTLMIENLMKSGKCKLKTEQELKGIIKYWPALGDKKTGEQTACLQRIIQDSKGTDSRQLVNISRLACYFVTMDYRFYRQFNARKKDIIKKCGINVFVMRPSDFMRDYKAGKI